MTFDPIEIDPNPWPGVVLLGLMWALPVIVFVLRRQSADPLFRRRLAFMQWVLCLGATLFTLAAFGILDPSDELLRLGIIYFAGACLISVVVVIVLRASQRRRQGRVA
jgi:Zn-dependent membrane protease YugP